MPNSSGHYGAQRYIDHAVYLAKTTGKSPCHRVANGLLLRSDLHILFDWGYLTVTPDYRVEVSRRIREEFQNGREYYAHHGRELSFLPGALIDRPQADFLRWHNEHLFVG